MTCESWQQKIDAYLDAELPEGETRELDAHLRSCASCSSQASDALGAEANHPSRREKIRRQILNFASGYRAASAQRHQAGDGDGL